MIPKSLSATSLQVASLCMARWQAEYMNRTPGFSGVAANIGTTCHGALEMYVKMVYMEKKSAPDMKLLKDLYNISYMQTFQSGDYDTDEYRDGLQMIERWYRRTDLSGVTVESCEVKETIWIPFDHPEGASHVRDTCARCGNTDTKLALGQCAVPFNYIMDRVDQISETEFRVVDYKSVRVPIQPDELHGKIQARAYALAVQIKYPQAQKIRVVFDLLRHDEVGIVVTREDNVRTWRYLKSETQRIVNTDADDVKPTLNMECQYCPIKATCPQLMKNISNGGILSLTPEEIVQRKLEIEAQAKGQKRLLEELDELLLKEAHDRDELEWDTDHGQVVIGLSRRRQIDASQVAAIIGPELFGKLGSITLGVVDNLIKDESLSEDQRRQIKELVYYKTGDPKPKIKPRKALA